MNKFILNSILSLTRLSPFLFVIFITISCNISSKESATSEAIPTTSLVILGTVQDAGSPHIACKKSCCKELFKNPDYTRKVVSLGLIDRKKTYLFEATPDITEQIKMLKTLAQTEQEIPDGIFLTHAHIGHYTGLMYLGKEAMNSNKVPIYAMPKMRSFLKNNGPWSQLVSSSNITIRELKNDSSLTLSSNLSVIPLIVPHRDEYSETVGYKIVGPNKKALFIPDIDKWEKWDRDIVAEISSVDYAFIDATFYDAAEINNRDISEIPHPFIIESMEKFKGLSTIEKKKIIFIHFNHSNPVLNIESSEYKQVLTNGFGIAQHGDIYEL